MSNTDKKYVISGLIGFAVILGWNIFLIQRDNKMFEAYGSVTQVR